MLTDDELNAKLMSSVMELTRGMTDLWVPADQFDAALRKLGEPPDSVGFSVFGPFGPIDIHPQIKKAT